MNLKEYFEKNPGLLSQFKKCTSKDEFMNVAQANNIRFGGNKLNEVYEYILSTKNDGEALSEDALEKAAGGTSLPMNIDPEQTENDTNVVDVDGVATIVQ